MKAQANSADNQLYKLLGWLDPDPVQAAIRYETVRSGLIRILSGKGCHIPEELADEVIERVSKNIDRLVGKYEGDPHHYFYAVAKNVYFEYTRRPKNEALSMQYPALENDNSSDSEADEDELECLRKCFDAVDRDDRSLVIKYYQGTPSTFFKARQELSAELGMTINHLRVRAHRVRNNLRRCYRHCRKQKKL